MSSGELRSRGLLESYSGIWGVWWMSRWISGELRSGGILQNYSGTKIGDGNAWEPGLFPPDHIWVPSIGVGGIKFYTGDLFPEFKNGLLIGSLKFQYLSYLPRENNQFGEEQLIFKNKIGRVRDIEVNSKGEIFLIADESKTYLYKLIP